MQVLRLIRSSMAVYFFELQKQETIRNNRYKPKKIIPRIMTY